VKWHPVTAVWVRSGTKMGIVPLHPLDKSGKTPVNLAEGRVRYRARDRTAFGVNEHGKMVRGEAARGKLSRVASSASAAPPRVSRYDVCGEYDGPSRDAGGRIVDHLRSTGTSFREREQSAETARTAR